MIFIRFISMENGFVTYEYGRDKEKMIGTVTIEMENTENVTFTFYQNSEIKSFCAFTGHTIGTIYKFIRENNFPKEYLYASG